jgi:hypothetical protein
VPKPRRATPPHLAGIVKACAGCGAEKSGTEFQYRRDRGVLDSKCRDCNLAYLAAYHERNKAAAKAKRDAARASDPEAARDRDRRKNLARKYGVTPERYAAMVAQQSGRCAACGGSGEMSHMQTPLVVDHCHRTGRVRGLLCARCNAAAGYFIDSPDRLMAGAAYLLSHMDVVEAGTR